MKTATMPTFRVEEGLRHAVEGVLSPGETLSAFMEESLRRNIDHRRIRQEFIARGLASREEARQSGEYVSSEDVLQSLAVMLAARKAELNI